MKLGIISDCIHYKTADGKVGTENHILLRQLQALCAYFPKTLICCPFGEYSSSKVISVYDSPTIAFSSLPVVGGDSLKDKFKLMSVIPKWWYRYQQVHSFSDVVYQRFPNNLNIPAFFYFWLKKKKVFATYTGTWKNYKSEPSTYRLQRWLLKQHFRGPVWVYANETNSKKIFPGFSPSYSRAEWDEEITQVNSRIEKLKREGVDQLRMITVGTLIDYKNQSCIIKACNVLKQRGLLFSLTVVGDGPSRKELEIMVENYNLKNEVKLVGKRKADELRDLYRQHDFVVQAPLAEGFGKVPIEGFFHGVIPVISNTSMAGYMTGLNEEKGFLFDATSVDSLVDALTKIKQKEHLLPAMIERGRAFAQTQTLEAWAQEYYNTLIEYFA
jgi:glycosyltransferase involved in cell wall biosynthesis